MNHSTPEGNALYFAHANGFPGASYRTFLQQLEPHFDTWAVPLLAHDGAFPVDRGWHSLSLQLESLLASKPRPFVGVGHSMGGVLMFLLACRRPEWFRGLVMLDPPLINGWQGRLFDLGRLFGQADRFTPAGKSKNRRDHWPDQDNARAYFGRRPLFQRFDSCCLEDYLQAGLTVNKAGDCRLTYTVASELAVFRTTPTGLDRLPALQVPGAMICGENSDTPAVCMQRHARRHRMLLSYNRGGHLFPLEYPREAANSVLNALASLQGERA